MNDRDNLPCVFLGMPGYGTVTARSARAFWRPCRDPTRVVWEYRAGSLLAQNFNRLWCLALNAARRGKRIDYFAMLHDDVEPEGFWLDDLIEELESQQLDVLGVVVPIKEPMAGVTSLALDRGDGDSWNPLCRLTMREIHSLPETFTSADVGHPLLLNTGCWVCRFDPAWARLVHFEINDRIVLDEATDSYVAQCEPEDWAFSRTLHQLGLRIGATRRIRLTHTGAVPFPNDQRWGGDYDAAYVAASQLPTIVSATSPSDQPMEECSYG